MSEHAMPPKKDVARALLLRGSVFVHLDPRLDGMVVPEWLRNQPQLVLQVGLDMPIPIPDLRVDDEGVYGTLSFQRAPFTCHVPWSGIFALVGEDGRGMVWPEDLPGEIASEVEREAMRRSLSEARSPHADDGASGNLTRLSDARGEAAASRERPQRPPPNGAARAKRQVELPPYLRVIK